MSAAVIGEVMAVRGGGSSGLDLGDFGALDELTYPIAFRTALAVDGERSLAEEVTQDAFVPHFVGASRSGLGRGAQTGLLRIVVNKAIDLGRRRRRFTMIPIVGEIMVTLDDLQRKLDWLDVQRPPLRTPALTSSGSR
jgi:DNA-directed RNA polymerase specialized sigma24 family protein